MSRKDCIIVGLIFLLLCAWAFIGIVLEDRMKLKHELRNVKTDRRGVSSLCSHLIDRNALFINMLTDPMNCASCQYRFSIMFFESHKKEEVE